MHASPAPRMMRRRSPATTPPHQCSNAFSLSAPATSVAARLPPHCSPWSGRKRYGQCQSAGVAALTGHAAEETVSRIAAEHGISLADHCATQISIDATRQAELILAMEQRHIDAVLAFDPTARGKTFLLGHWSSREIADPYRQEEAAYRHAPRSDRRNNRRMARPPVARRSATERLCPAPSPPTASPPIRHSGEGPPTFAARADPHCVRCFITRRTGYRPSPVRRRSSSPVAPHTLVIPARPESRTHAHLRSTPSRAHCVRCLITRRTGYRPSPVRRDAGGYPPLP